MRARSVLVLVVIVALGAALVVWLPSLLSPVAVPHPVTTATGVPVIPDAVIPADATRATIEYVHDGDTVFLTDGRKVRLLGIDTPEIGDSAECLGDEATARTRQLLPEGTEVWVQHDVRELDRYGRSLLFIYLDDGTNVNLELIREGWAESVVLEPNVLLADETEAAEREARSAGLGIWGRC